MKRRSGLGCVVLALILCAGYVEAQSSSSTAAPGAGNELNEVIVTARRTEERLQDVPISMSVISQAELSNRNITDAVDLANMTPSLVAVNGFGNENSTFAIRGFSQDSYTAPTVASYFADVVALRGPTQGTQAGDTLPPGSFFDLENIQVLKGPQGTLFGRNTTGGAVLLVPQKPTSNLEGYAEVSGGNFGMSRFQGAINLPLSDIARFRLAVDHEKRDGWLHNISGIGPNDFNDISYTAMRASLVVDVTANIENYTIASWSQSHTAGFVQKAIGCNPAGYNPPNPALGLANFIGVFSCAQLASESARGAGFYDLESSVPNPESYLEQWQVINTTKWSVSDQLSVKNIASYGVFKEIQRTNLFGTNWQTSELPQPYPFIFFKGIPAVFTGVFPIPGGDTADQSTYTEELQLQGDALDRRLTYQAGAYFEWSDPLSLVGNQSSQLAACTDPANLASCSDPLGAAFTAVSGFVAPINVGAVNYTAGRTTFRDHAFYAQSSYSITDQLKLTGGARYTWDEETNDSTRITYDFPVFPPYTAAATGVCTDIETAPSCNLSLQEKSSKPTWLLDLDYKPFEDALIYGKYARGYRAGGIYSNAPSDHRIFNPEKLDSYEIGLKTSFQNPLKSIFDIAFFYNKLSDQQLSFGYVARINPVTGLPAPVSPTGAEINAGKSTIYGVELDTSVVPLDGLVVDLNYSFTSAKIDQIGTLNTTDPNYQPAVSEVNAGSPFLLLPKHKFTLTADYTLPLAQNLGRVVFGANTVFTGRQLASYNGDSATLVQEFGSNLWVIPSRFITNLNLNWNSMFQSHVDLSFFATNLLDKHYYQYVNSLGTTGLETANPGEPRMYGARLRYRFGGH